MTEHRIVIAVEVEGEMDDMMAESIFHNLKEVNVQFFLRNIPKFNVTATRFAKEHGRWQMVKQREESLGTEVPTT